MKKEELLERIIELENEIDEFNDEKVRLENEIDELGKEIDEFNDEKVRLENEIDELGKERDEYLSTLLEIANGNHIEDCEKGYKCGINCIDCSIGLAKKVTR
jgi:uncharacterized coiled-coil DUF342 family protein